MKGLNDESIDEDGRMDDWMKKWMMDGSVNR